MLNTQAISSFRDFVSFHRDSVYRQILPYLPISINKTFSSAVREYVDRKGQYRRPSYVLLWALLYKGDLNEALLPAAVQQASEDFMLMHDDWFDSNTLRRGKPAAHLIYGPEYAVNAGNALHTITWKMAVDAAAKLGGSRGNRYLNKFYDIMLGTCAGQHLDMSLTRETRDITKFTLEDYYRSIYAKTAYYSVYGPMQIGAIVADAGEDKARGVKEYGVPAGMAFQIKDDILDCTSTEKELGKAIGTDVKDGVKTIMLWHAVQSASAADLERLRQIYLMPRAAKTEDDVMFVLSKFGELGSIKFAEEKAREFVADALKKFETNEKEIPESGLKDIARESIGGVVARNR